MEKQDQIDMHLALVAGILIFTVLSISIVVFFILYKRRLFRKHEELLRLESQHKEDLLFSSITSAENERKRMAADIHDELGSIFVTLSRSVNKLENESPAPIKLQAGESRALIEKGLSSVRRISQSIMPPELELYCLIFAMENFCEKLNAVLNGVEVDFNCSVEKFDQPAATGLALYRIMQELTSNTLKHAGASKINLQLNENEQGYVLHYSDNGAGFAWSALQPGTGLGLKNIESRVRMIKGRVVYTTSPQNGFSCEVIIPHQIIPVLSI